MMGRSPKEPLRALTTEEETDLESISRARSAPAEAVIRAKVLLAVASGKNYTQAAQEVGRRSKDAVATLVKRFNRDGLDALLPRHGGGFQPQYGEAEISAKSSVSRIWNEMARPPSH
jgi:hypothetical protein